MVAAPTARPRAPRIARRPGRSGRAPPARWRRVWMGARIH